MDDLKDLKKMRADRAQEKKPAGNVESSGKSVNVRFLIGVIAAIVVAICGGVAWQVNSNNVETVGVHKAKALADQVVQPDGSGMVSYPDSMNTRAKRSLYDNLDQNEELAIRVDTAVRYTKKDGWIGNRFKEREVANAIREELGDYNVNLVEVVELVKNQDEYK